MLSHRSEPVPHKWYFFWEFPHDQIPDLLPLLGVTEQDLCLLFFLNCILLFSFPSLSYSPLSLPLWGGLGPDLTPHWEAAHTLQPLLSIFGWVKAGVGWTRWQHIFNSFQSQMLGRSCFGFALSPRGHWDWWEQAGSGPQLCAVSSTQITLLALALTLLPPAATTEWEGNRKTEPMLGNMASALSPSWQDFIIQGFLAWSNRLFLAVYVRNQHKGQCTLLTLLSQLWTLANSKQANSKASQWTSPKSPTLRPSQRLCTVLIQYEVAPLSLSLQTQPFSSQGNGHTAHQCRMP